MTSAPRQQWRSSGYEQPGSRMCQTSLSSEWNHLIGSLWRSCFWRWPPTWRLHVADIVCPKHLGSLLDVGFAESEDRQIWQHLEALHFSNRTCALFWLSEATARIWSFILPSLTPQACKVCYQTPLFTGLNPLQRIFSQMKRILRWLSRGLFQSN